MNCRGDKEDHRQWDMDRVPEREELFEEMQLSSTTEMREVLRNRRPSRADVTIDCVGLSDQTNDSCPGENGAWSKAESAKGLYENGRPRESEFLEVA